MPSSLRPIQYVTSNDASGDFMKYKTISLRLLKISITALAAAILSANICAQSRQPQAMETIVITAQATNVHSELDRQRDANNIDWIMLLRLTK